MNSRKPEEHDADSRFKEARDAFVQRADASFDFESGLADIYARAALDAVPTPAGSVPPSWHIAPEAAAAVCRRADRLISILSLLEFEDGSLAFEHIQRARELTVEFRSIVSTAKKAHFDQLAALLTRALHHMETASELEGPPLSEILREKLVDIGSPHLDPCAELEALRDAAAIGFAAYPEEPGQVRSTGWACGHGGAGRGRGA